MKVTTHREMYGKERPAVNVKIYGCDLMGEAMRQLMEEGDRNVRFPDFYENLPEEDKDYAWDEAIRIGWDRLEEIAHDIFGSHVKVWSEGRSNGWAVVEGLQDSEDWEEEDWQKWQEWEKEARAIADDVPYLTLSLLYSNEFEHLLDMEELEARRFIADLPSQLVTE